MSDPVPIPMFAYNEMKAILDFYAPPLPPPPPKPTPTVTIIGVTITVLLP